MREENLVYIGTYTHGKSEGIYVCRMNSASGALDYVSKTVDVENPSYLAINPGKTYLYAVNEIREYAGQSSGAVSAFSINHETGELTPLNKQPSRGADPCYITVDETGKFVLVANYTEGILSVLPIQEDGRLGEATDSIRHQGSSIVPRRQDRPHAHSIILDSTNRYVFAPDLGMDKIMIYQFDSIRGTLKPNDEPWIQIKAGSGPRHFTFHPTERYAYLINELNSTMTVFTYNNERGTLREIQTVPTVPEDFNDANFCADIHVIPSGKFVYGSNRGHDSIVIYAIDQNTGKLTYVGHEPAQGRNPRNFTIDPTGVFLLAANQDTDNIVTFRIDQQTGKLESTGHIVEVPTPVCLKFYRSFQ